MFLIRNYYSKPACQEKTRIVNLLNVNMYSVSKSTIGSNTMMSFNSYDSKTSICVYFKTRQELEQEADNIQFVLNQYYKTSNNSLVKKYKINYNNFDYVYVNFLNCVSINIGIKWWLKINFYNNQCDIKFDTKEECDAELADIKKTLNQYYGVPD